MTEPKPYLSIAELAQLTPWSEQAIRKKMNTKLFREDEHYFHDGAKVIFKWAAVCEYIEKRKTEAAPAAAATPAGDIVPLRRHG